MSDTKYLAKITLNELRPLAPDERGRIYFDTNTIAEVEIVAESPAQAVTQIAAHVTALRRFHPTPAEIADAAVRLAIPDSWPAQGDQA